MRKTTFLTIVLAFFLCNVSLSQEFSDFEITNPNEGTGTFNDATLPCFTWTVVGTLNQDVQLKTSETFDDGNKFETRFGQANNTENLRIQIRRNGSGTAGDTIHSKARLTLTFNKFAPANCWGFCLVDIDVENALISAFDPEGNPVPDSVINNWLVELFDTDKATDGINIPKWDAANAAILGSDTPPEYTSYNNRIIGGMSSDEAGSAYFAPTVPIKTLYIDFENLQETYSTSYHFFIASEDQQAFVPDDNFEQALIDLGYDSGKLDDLVPSQNISNVTDLNVREKEIKDLTGIEKFTALEDLRCLINELTELDVSKNLALKILKVSLNKLTELDIRNNSQLWSLSINNNLLQGIDISKNLALRSLYCSENLITELDLTKNTDLSTLYCRNNKLTNLDVSNNAKLAFLSANGNQLSEIDVSKNTALSTLEVSANLLDELDLRTNTKLLELKCSNNQLTSLNLAKNTELIKLFCFGNQISALNLNSNTSLDYLNCSENLLTALDMKNNTILSYANCSGNKLQTINLSDNNGFVYLDCSSNLLPQIALTSEKLQYLNCSNNQLQNLELSHLATLYILYCDSNQIVTLDLQQNKSLYLVDCSYNNLSDLNIKNGNNNLLTGETTPLYPLYFDPNPMFDASNNPNLFCIQVDDVLASKSYPDWKKDANAFYSEDCRKKTYIPDTNFEQVLGDLGIDVDGLNDSVMTARIANVSMLKVSNKNIHDLTGIEYFTDLISFDCSNNKLVFSKLEPIFNLPNFSNLSAGFNYSPQAKVGVETDTSVVVTYDITLEIKDYVPGVNDIFLWEKIDGEKSLVADPTYQLNNVTFADSGQYICRITNSLVTGLTLQSFPINLSVKSLPVNAPIEPIKTDFSLYPNPSKGKFMVKGIEFNSSKSTIEIYNLDGKKLFEKQFSAGGKNIEIDVSFLKSGIYLGRIKFNGTNIAQKIIIRKN